MWNSSVLIRRRPVPCRRRSKAQHAREKWASLAQDCRPNHALWLQPNVVDCYETFVPTICYATANFSIMLETCVFFRCMDWANGYTRREVGHVAQKIQSLGYDGVSGLHILARYSPRNLRELARQMKVISPLSLWEFVLKRNTPNSHQLSLLVKDRLQIQNILWHATLDFSLPIRDVYDPSTSSASARK